MLCLGLDSGTTTCKGLVLEADTGKVLAQANARHSFVKGLPRGHVEQDPQIWSDAAERVILTCLDKIGERRSELVAFGASARQHGLVTLDDRNQPVRPAKLWCDNSTAEQAEKLHRALGNADELIERTGNAMVSGYTAPKILWLKENERKNFDATRTILLPHDFLSFWLTGERQMEYGDASGTGLLDIRSRTWRKPLAEFIDKDLLSKFPPLRSSTRPAASCGRPCAKNFESVISSSAPVAATTCWARSAPATSVRAGLRLASAFRVRFTHSLKSLLSIRAEKCPPFAIAPITGWRWRAR